MRTPQEYEELQRSGRPARFDWVGIGYGGTHYRGPGRRWLLTAAIG